MRRRQRRGDFALELRRLNDQRTDIAERQRATLPELAGIERGRG